MLDQPPRVPGPVPHVTPRKEREKLAEYLKELSLKVGMREKGDVPFWGS